MASTGDTIGSRFETQPNALNFIRLTLASAVIVWHSFGLVSPAADLPKPLIDLLGLLPVDGFFAISGFLIVASWDRRPQLRRFIEARARRILPGLWVCLAVTGFVIAPVVSGTTMSGGLRYVVGNLGVYVTQHTIEGTPGGVLNRSWNGPIVTLGWEVLCYLAVAVLGLLGVIRLRIVAAFAATFWILSAAVASAGLAGINLPVVAVARFGLMFSCGACLWLLRHRIPTSRPLALAAGAALLGSITVADYRLIAAPAIAYLCLYLGMTLGRFPRLVLRNDISYGIYIYGWPIQQTLLVIGFPGEATAAFAATSLLCTYLFALGSWLLVERPVLRRGRSKNSARTSARVREQETEHRRDVDVSVCSVGVTPGGDVCLGGVRADASR